MRSKERYVNFYDLLVKVRATHARIPSLTQLIDLWQQYGREGGLIHERENGMLRIRIGDMLFQEDHEMVILLVRRADQNAPNATFSNLTTGTLRVARKESHEGGDTAAHAVLSQIASEPNTYRCVIESVPGLSHRVIQALLNDLVRQACKDQGKGRGADKKPVLFSYDDPAGARRQGTPFQPHVELRGHLAEELADDLDNGMLQKVELVKSRPRASLGGDQFLVETEYKLVVEPHKDMPPQGRLSRIIAAAACRKHDFDTARISFKDRNHRSHTVAVEIDHGTPEQELYVRSALVRDIDPPLDQSCDTIQGHFARRLVELLVRERDGV